MAASKKQLILNPDGAGTGGGPSSSVVEQSAIPKPGFVSDPNFEDELLSIDVESDSQPVSARSRGLPPLADKSKRSEEEQKVNAPAITNTAMVGNVAKLKNSKLYQKFMKTKDTP
jgi:hypothetical protein